MTANSSDEESASSNKFSALLNPIRNIAQTFNIDIALELEEYLNDLENLSIRFDDGSPGLNFAQGSARIFSHKVELLHQLVYKVLNFLKERKVATNAADTQRRRSTRKSVTNAAAAAAEKDLEFSALDDMEEEDEDKIGLPNDQIAFNRNSRRSQHHLSTSVNLFLNFDLPPNLSYEDSNKNQATTNFKLSSCIVHESGALLLRSEDHYLIDYVRRASLTPRKSTAQMIQEDIQGVVQPSVSDADRQQNDAADVHQQYGLSEFGGMGGFDDGPFEDLNVHNSIHTSIPSIEDMMLTEKQVLNQIANEENDVMTGAGGDYSSFIREVNCSDIENNFFQSDDIWEPLDPHEEDTTTKKPFKMARPARKIHKKSTTDHFKVFDNRTKKLDISCLSAMRDLQQHLFAQRKLTHLFPTFTYELTQYSKLNFNSTYHPSFNYLAKLRQGKKQAGKEEQTTPTKQSVKQKQQPIFESEHEGDEDDNQQQDEDGYIMEDDNLQEFKPASPEPDPLQTEENAPDAVSTERRASRRSVSFANRHQEFPHEDDVAFGAGGFDDDYNDDTETIRATNQSYDALNNSSFISVMQSYEDLCKQHVEQYTKSTELYMQDAQIIHRVQDWQRKLSPFLEQQSRRAKFDIQHYSESVLDQFTEIPVDDDEEEEPTIQELDFQQISKERAPFEVCRLFLATLQLANSGNVEIQEQQSLKPNAFKVKLKTKQVRQEDFAEWGQ